MNCLRATCLAIASTTLLVLGSVVSSPTFAVEQALIRDLWEFNNLLDSAVGMKVDESGQTFGEYQLGPARRAVYSFEGRFAEPESKVPAGIASGSPAGFRDVSAESTIVGHVVHQGVPQSVYWRFTVSAHLLEPLTVPPVASEANAVTPDGVYIVGYTEKWGASRAYRWTSAGGMSNLGALGSEGTSVAYDISNDGSIVVGEVRMTADGPRRAFRWTQAGMQNLGTLGSDGEETLALAISGDGVTIVGASETPDLGSQAIVHTIAGGMTPLPTIGGYPGESRALAVSDNGSVIAGWSQSEAAPHGEACVWIDGTARSLTRMLEDDYGVDLKHWDLREARCSPNGLRFTGRATRFGRHTLFMIRLGPGMEYPIIEGDLEYGHTYVVRVGETRDFNVTVTLPSGGDLMRVRGFANDRMNWTVPAIPKLPSPRQDVFRCQPTAVDFGKTYDLYASFGTPSHSTVSNIRFLIHVPPNGKPTVEPIDPVTLECVDGTHTVKLSTIVDDADDQPLTVTWKVDGQIEQDEENVVAGAESTFEFDYDHGVHEVTVEVSDGYDTAHAGTTITVQDTQSPILVAAENVVVATDPGEAFASNVVLPPPTATDANGHGVTLASDARATYPLGLTLVTWTATDAFGNVGTATQKVTVEDREQPTIAGVAELHVSVDRGQIFSTAIPPGPEVSDNVTEAAKLVVTSDAPQRFPIGQTKVTVRATDEAGNFAERSMNVIVVNAPPKANAGPDRIVTTNSEKGAKVRLNGARSSDPEGQPLTFAWSSNKVKLQAAWSASPIARFPVGGAVAKLVVSDPAGRQSIDTVRVLVKLKNGKRRPRGSDANRSFAAATQQAVNAAASDDATLTGLAYANAAAAYGDAAGEFVRWEDGQSEADALPGYSELRGMQAAYGQAATNALLSAYAETGDESLLAAYGYAAYGTAYAAADLFER